MVDWLVGLDLLGVRGLICLVGVFSYFFKVCFDFDRDF